jgi:hypothetical protein
VKKTLSALALLAGMTLVARPASAKPSELQRIDDSPSSSTAQPAGPARNVPSTGGRVRPLPEKNKELELIGVDGWPKIIMRCETTGRCNYTRPAPLQRK